MPNLLTDSAYVYIGDLLLDTYKKREKAIAKIEPLSNDDLSSKGKASVDVLIVCALPEEREQVFEAFEVPDTDRKRILNSYRADYNFVYNSFTYNKMNICVVTQSSMGMANAASLTTRTILAMKPTLVAMTGICAGRNEKTNLGDIIIADQVYDYTAGKKYVDRFAARPKSFSLDEEITSIISSAILGHDEIIEKIVEEYSDPKKPDKVSVHLNTLASGTAVIDDKETMDSAAAIQDNLYGIDMEGFGVALASNAMNKKWIVIKAVQDFANGNKSTDENGIRKFSSYASAAMLKQIIPLYFAEM